MDRFTLSRLPFMAAFIAALAGMPLDIFTYNKRQLGTEKLSPWQRSAARVAERLSALSDRLLALIRTPRFWQAAIAAAVLLLVVTHHIPAFAAAGAMVMAGETTNIEELREKVNKLGVDMRALIDKAKSEERQLSKDEDVLFDKMDADREVAKRALHRAERMLELETGVGRRAEPQFDGEMRDGSALTSVQGMKVLGEHSAGLRAWFAAQLGLPLAKRQEDLARRLKIDLRSKEIRLRSPRQVVQSIQAAYETGQRFEERALSTLTSTSPEDGSYLIANEAMQPLERAMLAFGGVRGVSTVLRTRTGANLPIPTSDDTSNEGALLSENTQSVEKDTEFGQLVLGAFKFTSKKVLISRELFQDSNEDLGAFMFTALGERLARALNRSGTTGTGSSQPNGVVTAATSSGVALAAQTPTYAELVSIEATVDPSYRVGASWMFHDTVLQEVKKIVETTTGRPIWLPLMVGMQGGAPDAILGYPYTINQHMAVAAGSGSGKSVLFGNMKKFLWREVQDITVMRLDELYAEYYQVAFVAFARMDCDLLDAGTHPVKYAANHS